MMTQNYYDTLIPLAFLLTLISSSYAQDANVPEEYTFSKSMNLMIQFQGTSGNNIEAQTKIYYNPDAKNAIWRPIEIPGPEDRINMSQTQSATIYDLESRFLLEIPNPQGYFANKKDLASEEEIANYKKDLKRVDTDEYVDISGFLCQKIIYSGTDNTVELWVNQDIEEPNYLNWILSLGNSGYGAYLPLSQIPEGFPVRVKFRKQLESGQELILTFTMTTFNDSDNFTYDLRDMQIE